MSYTTKSGDTWDGIAKTVYGDELKADVLMTANREYAIAQESNTATSDNS